MSGSLDLTALEGEQEWLSVVLQLLCVIFLCTLLYDPSRPNLLSLTRTMGVLAVAPIVVGMSSDILQRASITSAMRYLAKIILLGGCIGADLHKPILPAISHLESSTNAEQC
jgi:hypothetical protein